MSVGKRRSDIAKLVTRAREVWRQSIKYQEAKKACKDTDRPGWYICKLCGTSHEVIQVDHIEPIGKQPDYLYEFGMWLERLFNLPQQGICKDCHKVKSKEDKRRIRKAVPAEAVV